MEDCEEDSDLACVNYNLTNVVIPQRHRVDKLKVHNKLKILTK